MSEGLFVRSLWNLHRTLKVLNPATGGSIAKVASFKAGETKDAIAEARKAFPVWKAKTAKQRCQIMRKYVCTTQSACTLYT